MLCIKSALRLGFTLDEIDELLTLAAHRKNTEELRRRASQKIAEIDARIANLREIRRNLEDALTTQCDDDERCSCGLGRLPLRPA